MMTTRTSTKHADSIDIRLCASRLRSAVERLHEENETVQEALHARIVALEKQLDEANRSVERYEFTRSSKFNTKQNGDTAGDADGGALASLIRRITLKDGEHNRERNELHAALRAQERHNEEVVRENIALKERIETVDRQLRLLRATQSAAESERRQQLEYVENWRQQRDEFDALVDSLYEKQQTLQAELTSRKRELEECDAKHRHALAITAARDTQIQRFQARIDELDDDLKECTHNLTNARLRVDQLEECVRLKSVEADLHKQCALEAASLQAQAVAPVDSTSATEVAEAMDVEDTDKKEECLEVGDDVDSDNEMK